MTDNEVKKDAAKREDGGGEDIQLMMRLRPSKVHIKNECWEKNLHQKRLFFVFISSKANNEVYLLLGKVGGPQVVCPRWQKQRDVVKTHLFLARFFSSFASRDYKEGMVFFANNTLDFVAQENT